MTKSRFRAHARRILAKLEGLSVALPLEPAEAKDALGWKGHTDLFVLIDGENVLCRMTATITPVGVRKWPDR